MAGVNQVLVTWLAGDVPTSNVDGPLLYAEPDSYLIKVWAGEAERVVASASTDVTVLGLRNGVRYSFQVFAVTANGRSEGSEIVTATPTTGVEGVVAGLIVEFTTDVEEGQAVVPGEERLENAADLPAVDLTVAEQVTEDAVLVELAEPVDLATAEKMAEELAADDQVVWAEPDQFFFTANTQQNPVTVQPVSVPTDTRYAADQWNLWDSYGVSVGDTPTRMTDAWAGPRGDGVTVAVIDTGITTHPDLDPQLVQGYDFVSNPEQLASSRQANAPPVDFDADYTDTARFGDLGRDANPADPGDWSEVAPARDSSWHGTKMAGLIAAQADTGGITGIAPGARIQPIRALSWRGGLLSDIAASITWAAGGAVDGVPANANPSKVINMSFAVETICPTALQDAIDAARERGSILIAAAGNANDDAAKFAPGNCNGVITVSATNRDGLRADYSNYGPTIDIAAPGGDPANPVVSTSNTGTRAPADPLTGTDYGTSVAAAHVTAAAAILASRDATLTPDQAFTLLTGKDFTKDFANPTCDANPDYTCGTGILSLAKIASVASGDVDYTLNFNGTSQYATAPDNAAFDITGAITVEAWVKPTSTCPTPTSTCMVVNKEEAYQLYAHNGKWGYSLKGGAAWSIIDTGVTPRVNQWQHLAFTRAAGANVVNFYVDGQLAFTGTADGAGTGTISDTAHPFTVGARSWNTTPYPYQAFFPGSIDEVRLFTVVRTASQIQTDMHTYGPTNTSGLTAYYDFNEGPPGTAGSGTVYNRASGAAGATNLGTVGSPTYADVKETTSNGSNTVVTFPRSYLTAAGGWRVPTGVSTARVLAVGGGGGGGAWVGGGGGGGGVTENLNVSVAASAGAIPVTVGVGGLGAQETTAFTAGNDGGSSSFGSASPVTALGGGVGASHVDQQAGGPGVATGGGGSFTASFDSGNFKGGVGATSDGGSSNTNAQPHPAGGGGGAGGNGGDGTGSGTSWTAGSGGVGVSSSITGASLFYGGGGGGSAHGTWNVPDWNPAVTITAGAGGSGGGGAGGRVTASKGAVFGVDGTSGRGGGGGGAANYGLLADTPSYGGDGGSGVVIVSFAYSSSTSACRTDQSSYTSGSTTYRVVTISDPGACRWSVPTGVTTLNVLAVGGGGGGGPDGGTGGGGGASVTLNSWSLGGATSVDVSVGAGGTGGVHTPPAVATGGADTTVDINGGSVEFVADGGYSGGGWGSRRVTGGGSATTSTGLGGQSGSSTVPSGGSASNGGTGGAGANDGGGTSFSVGGSGADGPASSVTGTSVKYGGGGGGGASGWSGSSSYPGTTTSGAVGGTSGGGIGSGWIVGVGNTLGGNGTSGFGGGGGGGGAYGDAYAQRQGIPGQRTDGGSGGSGVVILTYVDTSSIPCTPVQYPITSGGTPYTVVEFQGAGSCTWTVPTGVTSVDVLAVGGGGGGGAWVGGGGGGGGVTASSSVSVTPGAPITVTVGVGGLGAQATNVFTAGSDGGSSSFGSASPVTALGGGVGASLNAQRAGGPGVATGGGGSFTASFDSGNFEGGVGATSNGGSSNFDGMPHATGGGGGAGGRPGGNGSSGTGSGSSWASGAGGVGAQSDISGSNLYYGGGGGGSAHGTWTDSTNWNDAVTITAGAGGSGGGGAGGRVTASSGAVFGVDGTSGLGGGGGGAANYGLLAATPSYGGDGGSGVVIVRYVTVPGAPPSVSGVADAPLQATVSWTAPTYTGGSSITGYSVQVSVNGGAYAAVSAGTCQSSAPTSTSTTCTATGLTAGSTYAFKVTAINANGSGTQSSASSTITAYGELAKFAVTTTSGSALGSQTAGTSFNVMITAQDSGNRTVTNFTGTVDITSTSLFSAGSGTTAAFTSGVLSSHTITLIRAGTSQTVTATRTSGGSETGTSAAFTISSGPAATLVITTPAAATTYGTNFPTQPVITVQDLDGNTVTSWATTVTATVKNSGGTTLATATASPVSGVATFTGFGSLASAGTNTIEYTSGALTLATQNVVISQKLVTITASSPSVTYGDPIPTVTPSYSAFANGQTSSVLTSIPTCSTTYTPTSNAGTSPTTSCSGAVAANYSFAYTSGTVTIGRATPTFGWTNATKTYGDSPYTITAPTSSTPGSFTYASSNTPVIAIAGSVATVGAAGSATITATFRPTDTTNYVSGGTTTQVVTVNKASQSALSVTSTSGTYGSGLTLTTSGGSGSGALSYGVVAGTASGCSESGGVLSVTGVGTCLVTVTKGSDSNYNSVSSSQTTVTFAKATPSVTGLPTASSITYGQALSSSSLSGGTASVPGAFAFTSPSSTPAAGTAGQSVTFTPTDSANYNTVSVIVSVTVAKANQTTLVVTSTSGTLGSGLTLTTSGGSGSGAVTYVVVDGTASACTETAGVLSVTSAGTCLVTATKADDSNYNATSSVQTTITFTTSGGGGSGGGGGGTPEPSPSPSLSPSPAFSPSPSGSVVPSPTPTRFAAPTRTATPLLSPRPVRSVPSEPDVAAAATAEETRPAPTATATLVEEELVVEETPQSPVSPSVSPTSAASSPVESAGSDLEAPDAAPAATFDAQPPPGQSLLTDTTPVGPVMNLRVDLQIGASVEGRSAIVEAAGLMPGSDVQVLLYSEPMVIGTGVADGDGNASIATQIPGGLPPGQHTIMAVGTGLNGNPVQSVGAFEITADDVVTRFVEPAQVSDPIDPEDPQIARALEAGKPLYDVALFPAVIATVAVAGAAVVGLAGAGGLAGTGSGSSERSSRGKLAGVVTKKLKVLKASDAGLGDRSRTWAMPGTRRTDAWIKELPKRAGKFSALMPRVLVDGAWSRAMFGSFGFILWGVGLALGLWSAWSTGFEALPPALPLMLAIIALGILDAAAGAIAWVTIVVGALVTGNLTTWPEIRTALGLFVIFASIPLLAHVIRPLRRRISGTGMELFDRVADYVMPPIFLAFAAASMFKALNGLSGLELVSSEDFGEVRIVVIVAFLMRMAMEDIATYAYPVRSSEVQPEKLVSPGKGLALLSVAIRVGVFLIIAEPFFGLGWATYLSALLIAIPMALKVYEDDLPNLVWLNKWYPRGVANFAMLLVVGIYVSFWLLGQDATDEQVRQTYNFILLPGIVSGLIQLVGREGGIWPENWWKRAIGFVVWLFAVGIVTGVIALT